MQVTVPPPIQIVPSGSWVTWTRPARPSAVPWPATYGARGTAGPDQPARERGIQAARDRILDGRAVQREERPDLERNLAASGRRPDDADVEVDEPGFDGEDLGRARQEDRHPARAVVGPLGVDDRGARDPERVDDVVEGRVVHRPAPDERRLGEREGPVGPAADPDQPGRALLDDDVGPGAARRRPRARRGTFRASGGRRTAAPRPA